MKLKGFNLTKPSTLRPETDGFYQSKYWKAIRLSHLIDNPLCAACDREGHTRSATVVDHIIPRRMGGTDYPENLQSLCFEHHQRKSGEEGREAMLDNNPKWRK